MLRKVLQEEYALNDWAPAATHALKWRFSARQKIQAVPDRSTRHMYVWHILAWPYSSPIDSISQQAQPGEGAIPLGIELL